jgi:predicted kinase
MIMAEPEPSNAHDSLKPFLDTKPRLIVVTGIMASGKSTIARLLAQRFVRGVHVEADVLQHMIVSGGRWASEPGEPDAETAQQLQLRLKNMCLLGQSFVEAGFTVALDDIILGERWQQLQEALHSVPFTLVVLAPQVDVVIQQRDRQRSKVPQGETWVRYLDQVLRNTTTMASRGIWLDTSQQTPEETVDQILHHLFHEAVTRPHLL